MRRVALLTALVALPTLVLSWPDGAPCIHAAFESMNPLEAVEHQGGLQLTPPPFTIVTEQKCYWKNQPVKLALQGNSSKDVFLGFAIQPFVYRGARAGQRIGQFMRLDDNGSWRQQCFRNRDSVTHSHDEKKKKIELWYKNDEDEDSYVQATVVVALKQFWVKSVVSAPLPPCRIEQKISSWTPALPTIPPPAGQFKIETFHMFNQGDTSFLERSLSNQLPSFVARPQPRPTQALNPLPTTPVTPQAQFSPTVQNRVFQQTPTPRPPQNLQRLSHIIPQSNTDGRRNQACQDSDQGNRCTQWTNFCPSSTYMQNFCRRTCGLC